MQYETCLGLFIIPVLSGRWFVFHLPWLRKTMEHNGDRCYNFLSLRRNSTVPKCLKLVNFSQQFQRKKPRMTEFVILVLKCWELGRAGHISGGTVVQTRGLVSWRCTGVHWLGSLEVQQEGHQRVTAWDVALYTAPVYGQKVSLGHPLPASHLTIPQIPALHGCISWFSAPLRGWDRASRAVNSGCASFHGHHLDVSTVNWRWKFEQRWDEAEIVSQKIPATGRNLSIYSAPSHRVSKLDMLTQKFHHVGVPLMSRK